MPENSAPIVSARERLVLALFHLKNEASRGLWLFTRQDRGDSFTQSEIEFASALASVLAAAEYQLQNVR